MSIIIKANSSISSENNADGCPVSNVKILDYRPGYKMAIKYIDPDDLIIDGTTVSIWKGTLLIRNEDHYPKNIKDGTVVLNNNIKNKYKDTFFTDNNLSKDKTYYYRFFTYTSDMVYNTSLDGSIFEITTVSNISPIISENSWSTIKQLSDNGTAEKYWRVGDELDLILSGDDYNETVTLQVWEFNRYINTNDKAYKNITFGTKNLLKNTYNLGSSDVGTWPNSEFKSKDRSSKIIKCMPTELQPLIKPVVCCTEIGSASTGGYINTDEYVYIPSMTELGQSNGGLENLNEKDTPFPIFTDDNSRIKRLDNGNGDIYTYYTRTPFTSYSMNKGWQYIGTDGHYKGTGSGAFVYPYPGLCICFNV